MKNFPLFISDRLSNKLNLIEHDISDKILDSCYSEFNQFPISFIDIDESDSSCLTFVQSNKAAQIYNISEESKIDRDFISNTHYYTHSDHEVYTKYRSKIKVGRLINILFPNMFENSIKGSHNKKDIESFINMYKALVDREYKFSLIDIVTGEKIGYWYNYRRYANNNIGSLANSCMKSVNKIFYNIYMNNPEKVSLIILYSDDTKTKIKARALLWKLENPEGRFFMDRVYTNDYSDEQVFIDYAKKNNWLYKSSQSIGYEVPIIDPLKDEDNQGEIDLFVKIKPFKFRKFPYIDTLSLMNKNDLIIGNNYKHEPDRHMASTCGDYTPIERVYSKHYKSYINMSDAIYCQIDRDWVYGYDAVMVFNADRKYAIKDSSKIVYMTFNTGGENIRKPFLKKKCVWSDYLNTWIYYESVVNVYLKEDKSIVGIDHKRREGIEFFEYNGEFYADYLKEIILSK